MEKIKGFNFIYKSNHKELPNTPAVYAFRIKHKIKNSHWFYLYIGQSKNVKLRMYDHFGRKSIFGKVKKVFPNLEFQLLYMPDDVIRIKQVEKYLIHKIRPMFNCGGRKFGNRIKIAKYSFIYDAHELYTKF